MYTQSGRRIVVHQQYIYLPSSPVIMHSSLTFTAWCRVVVAAWQGVGSSYTTAHPKFSRSENFLMEKISTIRKF